MYREIHILGHVVSGKQHRAILLQNMYTVKPVLEVTLIQHHPLSNS